MALFKCHHSRGKSRQEIKESFQHTLSRSPWCLWKFVSVVLTITLVHVSAINGWRVTTGINSLISKRSQSWQESSTFASQHQLELEAQLVHMSSFWLQCYLFLWAPASCNKRQIVLWGWTIKTNRKTHKTDRLIVKSITEMFYPFAIQFLGSA